MDKIAATEHPPIANAADYIDALLRPRQKDNIVVKKTIEGRRMRDKFLDEVLIVEVQNKPS